MAKYVEQHELKVGKVRVNKKHVSSIRIIGDWINRLNFNVGDKVNVKASVNEITITKAKG